MSSALLNCDQVVALSQHSINNQLNLLTLRSVIPQSVSYSPSGGGDPVTVELNAPTILINANYTVQVTFNIKSGTLPDDAGDMVDVCGYSFEFSSPLAGFTLPSDADKVKFFGATQSQIDTVTGNGNQVQVVVPDLSDTDFSSTAATPPSGTSPGTFTDAAASIAEQIINGGNPIVLAITPIFGPGTGANYFQPTGVEFQADMNLNGTTPETGEYGTLNLLIMDQGNSFPHPQGSGPTFDWNTVPRDATVDGRFFIDSNEFKHGYILGLLLPPLATAMGGQAGFNSNWVYEYKTDNSQNSDTDNHGPIIDQEKHLGTTFTYSQENGVENHLELAIDYNQNTSSTIVLSGSGFFRQWQKNYGKNLIATADQWLHMFTVDVKKPFTCTITLSAEGGEHSGEFNADISIQEQSVVSDNYENDLIKPVDWAVGLFTKSSSNLQHEITSSFSSLDSDSLADFKKDAVAGLNTLSGTIILPSGAQYLFKNLTLRSNDDAQIDFTINS